MLVNTLVFKNELVYVSKYVQITVLISKYTIITIIISFSILIFTNICFNYTQCRKYPISCRDKVTKIITFLLAYFSYGNITCVQN